MAIRAAERFGLRAVRGGECFGVFRPNSSASMSFRYVIAVFLCFVQCGPQFPPNPKTSTRSIRKQGKKQHSSCSRETLTGFPFRFPIANVSVENFTQAMILGPAYDNMSSLVFAAKCPNCINESFPDPQGPVSLGGKTE